jgi:hypothetical protein
MLTGTTTKHGTGMLLRGDQADLTALHTLVHKLASYFESVEAQGPQANTLIDFAYEVRKAREGHREKYEGGGTSPYYGFRSTWPYLFVISNLLRSAAAHSPTTAYDQALLGLFEACMITALEEYDALGAQRVRADVGQHVYVASPLLVHAAANLNFNYLRMGATKQRFRTLAVLLHEYLSPIGDSYKTLEAQVQASAAHHRCSISEIEVTAYPDKFTW